MNAYLLSVLLGIIEGLTEFLPVSSTAHLRIVEELLGRYAHAAVSLSDPYWKMYTIVIQLGAILSLFAYFWRRILSMVKTFPAGRDGKKTLFTHPLTLTGVAFVCTAVPSLLLIKVIGKNLESLVVMGLALVVGGVVMWVVDAAYGTARALPARSLGAAVSSGNVVTLPSTSAYKTTDIEQMTFGQSVWIGCCQILSAVFPGTSRSMATIAAGQIAGMSRAAALEFSFILSIPTMVAATGYELLKAVLHKGGAVGAGPANTEQWIVLAIGLVVSFVVAYAVVAWFMNWVRTRGFVPFAIYRIIAGAAVLVWALK